MWTRFCTLFQWHLLYFFPPQPCNLQEVDCTTVLASAVRPSSMIPRASRTVKTQIEYVRDFQCRITEWWRNSAAHLSAVYGGHHSCVAMLKTRLLEFCHGQVTSEGYRDYRRWWLFKRWQPCCWRLSLELLSSCHSFLLLTAPASTRTHPLCCLHHWGGGWKNPTH